MTASSGDAPAALRDVSRVVPRPDPVTDGFWRAAREGALAIQRCGGCACFQHPPQPMCMSCGSPSVAFIEVSGNARLVSWTTTHHPVIPALAPELPYVCLVVELDEQPGLWLVSDLIGRSVDVAALRVDMPMRAVFDTRVGDLVLPQFVPAEPVSR
jgi:uncharacterized protein